MTSATVTPAPFGMRRREMAMRAIFKSSSVHLPSHIEQKLSQHPQPRWIHCEGWRGPPFAREPQIQVHTIDPHIANEP